MAVDYFLDIDGIPGESKDATHANQIDLVSFSWGASQPGTFGKGSGGTAGKVQLTDFSFTMQSSKATTALLNACATGSHIASAKLYCRKSTGKKQDDYMIWTMQPVIVASYQTGGSSGSEIPVDSVSLNFGKIKVEYKIQTDDKGTLATGGSFGWDAEKNASF
jgi:type VI secretion system secreted protein Hcp